LYNFDSKTIIYLDFINSMFSFTFDPLAAIFGIRNSRLLFLRFCC